MRNLRSLKAGGWCDPGQVTLGELVEGDGKDEDGGTRRRDVSVYEDKLGVERSGLGRQSRVDVGESWGDARQVCHPRRRGGGG